MKIIKYYNMLYNFWDAGGHYPVVQGIRDGYPMDSPNSCYRIEDYFGKSLDFSPDLDGIIFDPNATLTDYVDGGGTPDTLCGLLLSFHAREALKEFIDGVHQVYPATIFYRGATYPYYWVHFCFDAIPSIDFQKSEFWQSTLTGVVLEQNHLKSYEEYQKLQKSLSIKRKIRAIRIAFSEELQPIPGMFSVGLAGIMWVVSEDFLSAVKQNGLTGFAFSESPVFEVERNL